MTERQPSGYFWPCPRCQTANPAGSEQCRSCGTPNPNGPPPRSAAGPYAVPPAPPQASEAPSVAAPLAKRGLGPAQVVIAVLVLGAIAFVALSFLNQQVDGIKRDISDAISIGADPWTRSANYTTCDQWFDEMTDSQRRTMAGALLPILRLGVDTSADDGTVLTGSFADAISKTCRSEEVAAYDEYVITAAAKLAFFYDKRFQP